MLRALRIILTCWLLVPGQLHAQNLVLNGQFDEVNICTEYQQACSPVGWKATSALVTGYYRQFIKPYSGSHFLPLIVENTIDSSVRTYWQTRLLCPLQAGTTYTIRFYAGCWGGRFHAEDLGICFPETEIFQPENKRINRVPDIMFLPQQVSTVRKSDWLLVEARYTARGGEACLLIGNFLPDAHMTHHQPYSRSVIMYCIDDFSIEAETPVPCSTAALLESELRADHDRHHYLPPAAPPPRPVAPEPASRELRVDSFLVPDLLFEFDSSRLRSGSMSLMDSIASLVVRSAYDSVWVEGHTDDRGTEAYNLDLSGRRARTVASLLMRRGVDPRRVRISAFGETRPVAPNDTPENRRLNRRVVIRVLRKED